MLVLDLKNTGPVKPVTRTGSRTYRRGKPRIVGVVHRFAEGRISLMTSRVASVLIRDASGSVTFVTTLRSTHQLREQRHGLTSRKPTRTPTLLHFTSLRSRLDFSLNMSSKDGGKHSPLAVVSLSPRVSLVARFPRILKPNERS